MPLDDYDRELEADVRGSIDGAEVRQEPVPGYNDPASEYWRSERERQTDPTARRERAERSEREERYHRREREESTRRLDEERRGHEDWRERVKAMSEKKPPNYQSDLDNDVRIGIETSRGRHGERQAIEKWHQRASESGTTLPAAIGRWSGAEDLLRRDPLLGLSFIMRQTGLQPAAGD